MRDEEGMAALVRQEEARDGPAVERVVHESFGEGHGRDIVAVLGDLRGAGDLRAGLVAEAGGEVAGYVALSRSWLDARERLVDVLVLSPLGVLPSHQGSGVGTALLRAALAAATELGSPLVFLEGDPGYYGSRGFARASAHGLVRPSARIPDPACQVALLRAYEPWMVGGLVYPDCWWRRDLVGLRDPLLAQLEGR